MILSNKHHKYRVANFGNNCFCLTTSDLKTAVIQPISDEDLKNEINNSDAVNSDAKTKTAKIQASQTEKALMNEKQAQPVKPKKTLLPDEANQALWTEQSPKLGFFGFSVFFTIIYLIAVPALG